MLRKTGCFEVKFGRRRKSTALTSKEGVAIALQERSSQSMVNTMSFLLNQVIPAIQHLGRIIFMHCGNPTYITKPVMQLLKRHFRNDRIINCHFSTEWSPRLPSLNSGFGVILKLLYSVVRL